MTKDLTVGSPMKVLTKFCLPLFGSIIFQQIYNIADSLVAGRCISENALAAVGNSYEITLIYLAFAFGCNMGCSVISSRLYGEKSINRVKSAVYTSLISTTVLCVILMILGLTLSTPLLKLIKTPDEILQDSKTYLDIYTWGLLFVFIYNLATGIFTALGDSKTPFIFLAISSMANVGMDFLFVLAFRMGIAGVAWATFICQGVSAILAFIFVLFRTIRLKPLDDDTDPIKLFDIKLLKNMLYIAIPSVLQQSFISVGNIMIQSVINTYGTAAIAGYSAVIKLHNLMVTALTTLGNGMSNYTAQNIGANKKERLRPGFKSGLLLTYALVVPFVLVYFFFGRYILYLFLNENQSEEAISIAMQFLHIVSPFYFVVATKLIADGVLRGASHMGMFMAATFLDLVLRVGLAFILPNLWNLGTNGIWTAWPIGWCIAVLLSLFFYFYITKDKKKTNDPVENE